MGVYSNALFAAYNPSDCSGPDYTGCHDLDAVGKFCDGIDSSQCHDTINTSGAMNSQIKCFCATTEAQTVLAETYMSTFVCQEWAIQEGKCTWQDQASGRYLRRDYSDPCLIYFDAPSNQLCARCKFGALRMITTSGQIVCGTQELSWNAITNQVSVEKSKCRPANWYYDQTKWINLNLFDDQFEYLPSFKNVTSQIEEKICMSSKRTIAKGCIISEQNLEKIDMENLMTAQEIEWAKLTVGCRQCDNKKNYYGVIQVDAGMGLNTQDCLDTSNQKNVENDVCGNGSIKILEGLIPTKMTLVCKECSSIIPNCMACRASTDCVMCKLGYRRAQIKDAYGNDRVVCVNNFCGFYGAGSSCDGKVALEGCDLSTQTLYDEKVVETCKRCSPGYYKWVEEKGDNSQTKCFPSKDKKQVNLFLKNFDHFYENPADPVVLALLRGKDTPGYDSMISVASPAYSFGQALAELNKVGNDNVAQDSNQIIITVYLSRGVHHLQFCQEHDKVDLTAENLCDPTAIFMCFNSASTTFTNLMSKGCPGMSMQETQTLLQTRSQMVDAFMFKNTFVDNWVLTIKAADCDFIHNELITLDATEKQVFLNDFCVHVSDGERPEFRISSTWTYFNITNKATFKDIIFTGEDLFAKATKDGAPFGYMGDYGYYAFVPAKKCEVLDDPNELTTIDNLHLRPMMFAGITGYNYDCVNPFQKKDVQPPWQPDERCFNPEYNVSPNSAKCSGDPYHEDFFNWSTGSRGFMKRHKTLFNLYAFDKMRTKNTAPPSLEIINCSFKYFVNSLDSIIQVETNNLGFIGAVPAAGATDERFLTFMGEDRGAKILIESSEVKSSSFCKGFIYYNEFQSINYDQSPTLLNFTANFQGNVVSDYEDKNNENFIKIYNSTFKNLGFNSVIQALRLKSYATALSSESFVSKIPFNRFMDQGMILNLKGFTGTIQVRDSRFIKNMAYIQQILNTEYDQNKPFFDFDDNEMQVLFGGNNPTEQLQFKICVDKKWTSRYLFQDVIDPNTNFNDAIVVNDVETVAPFYIKGNQKPIIFVNNVFSQNIGTTGGAIHIEDPDFRYYTQDQEKTPYIVMKNNQFLNNMAYWAGNAFHIQMTVQTVKGMLDVENSDSWQTCGSGILIDSNFFSRNIGMKRHNGGAGVIRCQHAGEGLTKASYRSGKTRTLKAYNGTALNGNYTTIELDNPAEKKAIVQDLIVEKDKYEVMAYGTTISNNTFSMNYSGKRGSALLIEQISHLEVEDNQFMQNGPVHAQQEMQQSPYYKTFLYNNRTLSFYEQKRIKGDCIDEFSWLNRCNQEGTLIDMPQLQGALHIVNCYQTTSCFFVNLDLPLISNNLKVQDYSDFFMPWQQTVIRNNYFYDNHANIVMLAEQKQSQASSLYIVGGTNTTISENQFSGHRSQVEGFMRSFAYDVYNYYPKHYFGYSQASLIRIEYPLEVFPVRLSETAHKEGTVAFQSSISENEFSDNLNMQVLTYAQNRYKAGIIDFDCHLALVRLNIEGNSVTRTQFIGRHSTFFYINGGISKIHNNSFSYSGMLYKQQLVNSPDTYDSTRQFKSYFPWESYDVANAQDKGIFWFDFERHEMPKGTSHDIQNNNFTHIYCQQGCAYYATGNMVQQFTLKKNIYSVMVSSAGAAVFYGNVPLPPSNEQAQVWIMAFVDERFEKIFGGAIQLSGNNVPISLIANCVFINNFGATGAAINFNAGGGLYIESTKFMLEQQHGQSNNDLDQVYETAMLEIYTTYDNRLSQSFLFDREMFGVIKGTKNTLGQIYLKYTENSVQNDQQTVIAFDGKTLQEISAERFKLNFKETKFSSLRDCSFKQTIGGKASGLYIDTSFLQLIGMNDDPNFINNSAPLGSTIFATFSEVVSQRMYFLHNLGRQGGAYLLDSTSSLLDTDTIYESNKADQGGVVFAINDSKFDFKRVQFLSNKGKDGSLLYAMYNSGDRALSFSDCIVKNNTADQNLMQLMSSQAFIENSYFEDNSAQIQNHGINMITSQTEIYNSTVTFSPGFADKLDLSKLDCGFFSMFLGSKLTLAQNSEISNLQALNKAVLCAFSQSSVFVSDSVTFRNNVALSASGQTLSMANTAQVIIQDAHFENNPQINLQIELGSMNIINSTFTNGSKSHVKGIDSILTMEKVHMYDSKSETTEGHGLNCQRCKQLAISDSKFENLTSNKMFGAAINILSLQSPTEVDSSYIKNNEFINNAAGDGGAISITFAQMLEISGNKFERNTALRRSDGHGLGGAILYACDPQEITYDCNVALINNTFRENEAASKGGALRYENANFTDQSLAGLTTEKLSDGDDRLRRRLQEEQTIVQPEVDAVEVEIPVTPRGNVFENNKAPYGADFASFPKYIQYNVPENDSGARIDQENLQIRLAAGQTFRLEMTIIDREGRVYNDENSAIAKMEFLTGQDLGQGALMFGAEAVCKNGRFVFESLEVRIKPKSSAYVKITFQGMEAFGTPIGFLDDPPIFNVTARECIEGESYTENLSCEPCKSAFYLYEAQTEAGLCEPCHPNAHCYGMNNTAPKAGYWRSRPKLEMYTPCLRPESCLGGNATDQVGQCEVGYQGILCSECATGYSKAGLECSLCPEFVWNILTFIGLMILLIFVIALLVKSTLGGVEVKKPLYSVLLKIFMGHFQILAAVSQINFKWPKLIQTVLQSQQGIADGPARILSVDCILMDLFPDGKPTMRLNYIRLIIFTCMPVIIYGVSQGFWFTYGKCKRMHEKERSDKGTATAIIVLFLFYPTIVQIVAKTFNCKMIEEESRLFDDLEEVCFQGMHMTMLICVSLPGIFAWALGIPGFALRKLVTNVASLAEIKKKAAGAQHEDLLRSFKVRLGFLTAGYDDAYYYWEIILLMRKSLLVLIIVFLSSVSSGVQSLISILMMTTFLLVQESFKPYYDPALNKMETLSLMVIICTIYFGLYYQAGEGEPIMQSEVVSWMIFTLVLAPSIAFIVNFSQIMWIEILKVVAGKSARVFRFVTCGSRDITTFKMQYMDEVSDDDDSADEIEEPDAADKKLGGFGVDSAVQTQQMLKALEKAAAKKELARRLNEEDGADSMVEEIEDEEPSEMISKDKLLVENSIKSNKTTNAAEAKIKDDTSKTKDKLIDQTSNSTKELIPKANMQQNFKYAEEELEFRGENETPYSTQQQSASIGLMQKQRVDSDPQSLEDEIEEESSQKSQDSESSESEESSSEEEDSKEKDSSKEAESEEKKQSERSHYKETSELGSSMMVNKMQSTQAREDLNTPGKKELLERTLLSGVGDALKDEEISNNLRSQSNMRGRNNVVGLTSMVKDRDDVQEKTREEAARSRQQIQSQQVAAKKEQLANKFLQRLQDVEREDKALADKNSLNRKKKSPPNSPKEPHAKKSDESRNIFRKSIGGDSKRSVSVLSRPTVTKDQFEKKTKNLFNRKRQVASGAKSNLSSNAPSVLGDKRPTSAFDRQSKQEARPSANSAYMKRVESPNNSSGNSSVSPTNPKNKRSRPQSNRKLHDSVPKIHDNNNFMSDEEGGVADMSQSPALVKKQAPVAINFAARPNDDPNDDVENADNEAEEVKGQVQERKRKRARHRKNQKVSAATDAANGQAAGKGAAMQPQNAFKTPATGNKLSMQLTLRKQQLQLAKEGRDFRGSTDGSLD